MSMITTTALVIVCAATSAHAYSAESSSSSSLTSSSAQPCREADDCHAPPTACHSVACYESECVYERLSVDECCLTSEECCSFASAHQVGICDKNCTCQFVSSLQCTVDSDCDALISGLICRGRGECFLPMCERGLCDCLNTTAMDLDADGVSCPDDCDDLDPSISRQITCFRDYDNDHYPTCTTPTHYHHDDDDDGGGSAPATPGSSPGGATGGWGGSAPRCMQFCVGANETCPYGWADPSDPERFEKVRSRRSDTGVACDEELSESDEECDCCDRDTRTFPGSMYASNRVNKCGDSDYNCDGETTQYACCDDGHVDTRYYRLHRTLWYDSSCIDISAQDDCGGCSTTVNGTADLVVGWACEETCGGSVLQQRKKRTVEMETSDCPSSCNGECVCVDEQTAPVLGECAKLVTSCIEVRPEVFGDGEECCVLTIQ